MPEPGTFAETAAAITRALYSQGFMGLMGAEVVSIAPGELVMALDRRDALLQQHGFFHGGVIGFLVDNTTTSAAATVIDIQRQSVLTAEYKLNILAPATGSRLVCRATVVKPGRKLTVVDAKVHCLVDGRDKLVAVALATIANLDTAVDTTAA
ncbi:PaaI family thioesterase [Chelatococcus reniformis]|uniref:Thioesterase n=1 Tax=Chelatococcus reniformis TaxID=1494448 RepID=A0A916XH41_9HYPH|nr:PaaI family thioesterase [Chelatococcus reniformis]GGC73075.1 thioesterase [Chelatococcus reniformis]